MSKRRPLKQVLLDDYSEQMRIMIAAIKDANGKLSTEAFDEIFGGNKDNFGFGYWEGDTPMILSMKNGLERWIAFVQLMAMSGFVNIVKYNRKIYYQLGSDYE